MRISTAIPGSRRKQMSLVHPDDLNDSTLRGEDHGASISLIIDESEPGQGPRLHRHAYDETWVIQKATSAFKSETTA